MKTKQEVTFAHQVTDTVFPDPTVPPETEADLYAFQHAILMEGYKFKGLPPGVTPNVSAKTLRELIKITGLKLKPNEKWELRDGWFDEGQKHYIIQSGDDKVNGIKRYTMFALKEWPVHFYFLTPKGRRLLYKKAQEIVLASDNKRWMRTPLIEDKTDIETFGTCKEDYEPISKYPTKPTS